METPEDAVIGCAVSIYLLGAVIFFTALLLGGC